MDKAEDLLLLDVIEVIQSCIFLLSFIYNVRLFNWHEYSFIRTNISDLINRITQ